MQTNPYQKTSPSMDASTVNQPSNTAPHMVRHQAGKPRRVPRRAAQPSQNLLPGGPAVVPTNKPGFPQPTQGDSGLWPLTLPETDDSLVVPPDVLEYLRQRYIAATDYFRDGLAHVVAHVAGFQPEGSNLRARGICVPQNVALLRQLLAAQGFTHPAISPDLVLKRYMQASQMEAQMTKKYHAVPSDIKASELEDCIFILRSAVADLYAAISRLFPNFCPLVDRPRLTTVEAKRAATMLASV